MKYFYLILITLITNNLCGQDIPVISPDNHWNIYSQSGFSPNSYTQQYTFSPEVTIIQDQEYHELLTREEENGELVGTGEYFREEGEKVFEFRSGSEHLIYDFSIEVGDSISYNFADHAFTMICVQKSEFEMLNQTFRTLYIFKCCDSIEDDFYPDILWLEGIGDMSGIGQENSHCATDIGSFLSCFHSNQELLFENMLVGDCWKVDNREVQQDLYRIFPNPVQDYLNIEDLNTPFEYIIKTMEGKTILRGKGEQRIEVQQLPAGMYVLEIMTENKIGVMKFVKR